MKYIYNSNLLNLLKLNINSKYEKKYIFKKLNDLNFISLSKVNTKKNIYFISHDFLSILLEVYLFKTKESFYKLFYLKVGKWRNGLKNGFGRNYIYKMIDSLCINYNIVNINFYDEGRKNIYKYIEL